MRGYDFLVAKLAIGDTTAVFNALAPSFDNYSEEAIYKSMESYNSIDSWNETPVMTESAYNRLIDIMKGAGQLSVDVPMNKIIDNTIANELLSEMY